MRGEGMALAHPGCEYKARVWEPSFGDERAREAATCKVRSTIKGRGVADRGLTLESLPLIPILIHERSGQTSSTWATKEMVNYIQKYEAWLAAK